MRRPDAGLRLARALLAEPDLPHYGWPLGKAAKVRAGLLYPWLQRFLERGWLRDHWEQALPHERGGRPPRRYYTVTPEGRDGLAAFVAEHGGERRAG